MEMTWLWWGPLFAVILHITEEFIWPGGFAEWDRVYRPQIRQSITPRLHIIVNLLLIAFCMNVGLAGLGKAGLTIRGEHLRSGIPSIYAGASWIALTALLFSNAIFHIVGSIQTGRYSPGLFTGVLLYIPLAIFGCLYFVDGSETTLRTALIAAALGGSYHVWARMIHTLRARG
jgi:hypothetical protein